MPTELRLLKKTFEHADKIIAKKIYSSVKKIHSRVWITCVYSRAWIAVWKNTQWVSWLPFCISKVEKELDPNEVLTAGVLTLPFTAVTTQSYRKVTGSILGGSSAGFLRNKVHYEAT